MKKKSVLIGGIVVAIIVVIGLVIAFGGKKVNSNIKSVSDIKAMFNNIYRGVDLPSISTDEYEANIENVKAYTGLSSNENVEKLVVSEPLMNAQAFSSVAIIVKDGSNIEDMKQEMLDNINMNKWICVSAEKLYITNNGNVIFLVMSSEDRAKPVYENFKKYVNNEIGKELEKENNQGGVELPPIEPVA